MSGTSRLSGPATNITYLNESGFFLLRRRHKLRKTNAMILYPDSDDTSMSAFVEHPNLSPKFVQARAYQLIAVDQVLSRSTLLILPTAAGKTAVAWMAIAQRLLEKPGWILFIAPTVALVNQHMKNSLPVFRNNLNWNILSISGKESVETRQNLWGTSKVVFATPQVVRNDVKNGRLSLKDCCMLVVDEAHHCVGSHAMRESSRLYLSQAKNSLIIGTTASPSSRVERIQEICNNLEIKNIHLRTREDRMLRDYLSELEINEVKVDVPNKIRELAEPFIIWQKQIVDKERRIGRYVYPGEIGMSGLANAMDRSSRAIKMGDSRAYSSVSNIATAMRLNHLINHLLCQGITAAGEFLDRMLEESEKKKSAKEFLDDYRVRNLIIELSNCEEFHSKISAIRRIVIERLRNDEGAKIIIFSTFRDTVRALEIALSEFDQVKPIQFIGQSSKSGSIGLSPKKQIDRLEKFKKGEFNVLIATSVGEEGLDIPSADLAIFYEPVASEIRMIQRRGRTGRKKQGDIVVLIARGTMDERALSSSRKKEEYMHKSVRRVARRFPSSMSDLSNIADFHVILNGTKEGVIGYVNREKEKFSTELSNVDDTLDYNFMEDNRKLPPQKFRPEGQTGLEQF